MRLMRLTSTPSSVGQRSSVRRRPSSERVNGWQVVYPFDSVLNEQGEERRSLTSTSDGGLTTFSSSDASLDAVWALVRHSATAGALDLNTDSNTRQRDLCTLDAWLASRYQGSVAPASAHHLRRRMTQIMWERNGYVRLLDRVPHRASWCAA